MDAIGSALSGMDRATQLLNNSARQIANEGPEPEPLVNTKVAETSFAANVAVARTAFEIEGTALDLLA